MKKPKIIISGGGTGGHIFPAIAIANSIRSREPQAEILFIGALGRMEMEKVPRSGYPIEGLWISGIQRRLTLKNLLFPVKLLHSLFTARKIIKRFKPDVVIGVGGYASGPTLRMAARLKIPSLIQEQNSYPGITNRWLAAKAQKICVAYEGMERYFPKEKLIITGNPIRNEMIELEGKRQEAKSHFRLREELPTVLIIGGSQGARSINQALKHHIKLLASKDIQIIWQTGPLFYREAMLAARPYENKIRVTDFIYQMDLAYAAADVIVSRAGAIAIAEICNIRKPAIFVPLPSAAEDHQTKNAEALVKRHAALMIKDQMLIKDLPNTLLQLVFDQEKQAIFSENLIPLGYRDAGDTIAGIILKMAQKHN